MPGTLAKMWLLPDDLLRACLAALDCPHSFAAAGQVCRQWASTSALCSQWNAHIKLCKLERGMDKPVVVDQEDIGICTAAVAYTGHVVAGHVVHGPCGHGPQSALLYTCHQVWTEPAPDDDGFQEAASFCKISMHVWDIRPHLPTHLHQMDPTGRESDHCCMHVNGGFLAIACQSDGRPQIRHSLRPAGKPGMALQTKLSSGGMHTSLDDCATAIHIRQAKSDVFVGYASGKLSHHDLESGVQLSFAAGGHQHSVCAISSHGWQVFIGGQRGENACVNMFTTKFDELFGVRLRHWGAFLQPRPPEESWMLLESSLRLSQVDT
jgi:hypothetical protein